MSDLLSRLTSAASCWADANDGAPLSRLGKRVAGDANFFSRIERPGSTCNVATLEKFARFLGDGANWPAGRVPNEVETFVHITGVTIDEAALSPGKDDEFSPRREKAA